jgi:hypothetical protein
MRRGGDDDEMKKEEPICFCQFYLAIGRERSRQH